jgi:hypothetical protein
MKKMIFFSSIAGILFVLLFLGNALAGFYIQYNEEANRVMQMGGVTKRGNFADKNQCESYQRSRSDFEQKNSWCVCTPNSAPSTGGYSSKQDFQMQMFQGLLGAFMQGIMQESSSQSQAPATKNVKLATSPEEKAMVKAHMEKMENEYNKKKQEELKTGLAGLKKGMKGREDVPITEKSQKEIHYRALAQLNCSAYWGIKAARSALSASSENTALNGPDEFARVFGEYSAQAAGTSDGSGCPELKVNIPDVPQSGLGDIQSGMYEFIISEVDVVIPEIRILQDRKKVTKNTIAVNQGEIKKLENKRDSAATKDEKAKIDTLMQDALNALKEAQAEDAEATEELEKKEQKLTALEKMYSYYQNDDAAKK